MGAYLSEPVTEKISTDDESVRLRYGASSMQGWRVSQEDAHNCLIDFDKNTTLFAVYDGHGGHEVAAYCSQKLPQFIKETEAYKKGDLHNALIDAFLGFDETIATREVVSILKEIVGVKNDENADDNSEDEEENVNNLYEEASMPIEQVMEKYQSNLLNPNIKKLQGDSFPVSPMLKARKTNTDGASASGASSSGASSSKSEITENSDVASSTVKVDSGNDSNTVSSTGSDISCSDSISTTSNGETKTETETENEKPSNSTSVSSVQPKEEINVKEIKKPIANGETPTESDDNTCTSSISQENGEVSPSVKGKGKAIVKKNANAKSEVSSTSVKLRARNARQLYNKLLEMENEESDSEDDNDVTFEGAPSNSSSEEGGEESSEGADDEEEDEEEEEEDEEIYDDDDEDNEFTRNMTEEPGSDSGCTAVVALLRDNELYVANAGDSRCIVCRKGQAIEMSLDHKPEDEPEMARVVKAGGRVTQDGRVNGGLNLSRAIGDHAYKQNKELSNREQMITALPDIKTLTINPAEDEFMVLACDGIWNFMSSQEVVDFVRPRLFEGPGPEKLSQICEEIFDHCLAPNTMGDGTGCDNMTAVIIQFKNPVLKRSASPDCSTDDVEQCTKKAKTDHIVTSAAESTVVTEATSATETATVEN